MNNNFDLKDKVAIVTGSSKGIGAAIAEAYAAQGAKVVVSSRKQVAVDEVAEKINAKGGTSIGIECHVGKQEQLENLVNKTVEQFGKVDVLVNNAATNPVFDGLQNATEEAFNKIMNVNVKACMMLTNLCYKSMKENGGGSIINIASVEGFKPSVGLGMYSISKAALIMLTKSQAKEWSGNNIRSNVICPGLIKTKFSQALWSNETILDQFETHIPMKRMGESEEISGLACYLASDSASYTTGGVFMVDGGYMLA